jgi:hypothetical protein
LKAKPSKLDPHAERLEEWFLAGKPLLFAQHELALDGVHVSLGRLSEWWQARQAQRQEDQLLAQIASGAETCRKAEEQFGAHPAPEMQMVMKTWQVIIFKLTTAGQVDRPLLDLATRMMQQLINWHRVQQTAEQLSLDRQKFEFDAARACLAQLPDLKAISADSALSETDKVDQIRLKLFGAVPGAKQAA